MIKGIKLVELHDEEKTTGISVLFLPDKTVGGVDVRGGAPGTRETDLLRPENTVPYINAIALCGGSAFGLEAVSGIMRGLRERSVGYMTGGGAVPIVPACVIYDLEYKKFSFPDIQMGERAVRVAFGDEEAQESEGAGTGATVSKLPGIKFATKSGSNYYEFSLGELSVGAYVVVNALGDIYDGHERLTGLKNTRNEIDMLGKMLSIASNTTIGAIVTNAKLTKSECTKVAQMAHDGLARAIRPIHTAYDGDTIFSAATGEVSAEASVVGALGAMAIERAIIGIFKPDR